jgi:pimeloyl-ACP methyl ester carboxylesterase
MADRRSITRCPSICSRRLPTSRNWCSSISERAGAATTAIRALWTLDTWIEDVPAFCEALELSRPILLGQSFGGFVALGVAACHPELGAKLIVSSSAARLRPDRALAMFERLGGPQARAVAARWFEHPDEDSSEAYRRTCLPLYNPTPADPDAMARARFRPDVGIRFWRDELPTLDLFAELGRIRCPTLILAGELDPLTTVRDHEEPAGAITGSRLEVFADAGHGVYRDKPNQALTTIRSFLLDDGTPQPRAETARAATPRRSPT